MANRKCLKKADKADDIYTQMTDIENVLQHYRSHFTGKFVYCNCDDPFESNFFKYFLINFNSFALKKLISTCYNYSPISGEELPVFNLKSGRKIAYQILISKVICNIGDYAEVMGDVGSLMVGRRNKLIPLKGNGDFRSDECIETLKKANIIVTHPPHSLFREYVAQLMEYKKKFLIIGRKEAAGYEEISSLIKKNRIRIFSGFSDDTATFYSPRNKGGMVEIPGTVWFTNLDI